MRLRIAEGRVMIVTDVGEKWVSPRFFAFLGGVEWGWGRTARHRVVIAEGQKRRGRAALIFQLSVH